MDCSPLCSFNASATVSKPKCVVPGASCGDFGGGVCCCACLTEHEKHRYGSLTTVRLLPASNWRPSRVRDACMVVYRMGWSLSDGLARTFSIREGTCLCTLAAADVRLGKKHHRPKLAAECTEPHFTSPDSVIILAGPVCTENVALQKCRFVILRGYYVHRGCMERRHASMAREQQYTHLFGRDAEVWLQHQALRSLFTG
jgi:hypothetical protein